MLRWAACWYILFLYLSWSPLWPDRLAEEGVVGYAIGVRGTDVEGAVVEEKVALVLFVVCVVLDVIDGGVALDEYCHGDIQIYCST